jgi:tRNA U34 2-thiouridine synthase MnmA/TrmU
MKAIALFSGGLDSILAIKIINDMGIEVIPLYFLTPFCSKNKETVAVELTKKVKHQLGLDLRVVYLGDQFLAIVRKPKYGYGKNFNPCIDCKILFLSLAKEIMQKEGADFLITGEVVGQRPKSQHKDTLRLIEQTAQVVGLLVRPLSAKHLPLTLAEQNNWIARNQLFDFYGRNRKPQLALATKLGITEYAWPGGGCLLTEAGYCRRLKDLFQQDKYNLDDVELLKLGRHFRLNQRLKFIVGRNEKENELLFQAVKPGDIYFMPKVLAGPSGLIRGSYDPGQDNDKKEFCAGIIARYTALDSLVEVMIKGINNKEEILTVQAIDESELNKLRI